MRPERRRLLALSTVSATLGSWCCGFAWRQGSESVELAYAGLVAGVLGGALLVWQWRRLWSLAIVLVGLVLLAVAWVTPRAAARPLRWSLLAAVPGYLWWVADLPWRASRWDGICGCGQVHLGDLLERLGAACGLLLALFVALGIYHTILVRDPIWRTGSRRPDRWILLPDRWRT